VQFTALHIYILPVYHEVPAFAQSGKNILLEKNLEKIIAPGSGAF
jgi:hypothetical protein